MWEHVGALEASHSRQSHSSTHDDTTFGLDSTAPHAMTTTNPVPESTESSPRRFTLYFQDDNVRQRSQAAIHKLLITAVDNSGVAPTSSSAVLAKKALRYRKIFDRMSGVDVSSPQFDVSKFLGVAWCHTPSLKAHCARAQ